ncbi:EAL domain-containing protein [Azonexus sp. IMCC34842]|uniref:EAL domain-containing protein n=1 Tax=Azonexus sp. IMCC34842 TaxID=3420950 RepID=UPI003D0ABD06
MDASSSTTAESRRKYLYLQAVMSSMPQGISVFDENLRLRVWNQGFIDVLNLPAEAVYEGVPFADLIRIPAMRGEYGPGDVEEHIQRKTAQALQFEGHCFERTRPSGRTHLVQGEPLFIDGQLTGFITTYTDITERKAAEQDLRAQHDLLQTVIESIPSAVSLFDREQKLILHNQEFVDLLGLPPSLIEQTPVTLEKIFRFNAGRGEYGPGDPETIVQNLLARANPPTAHRMERTRPNGKTLDIRGVPLADGSFVTVYTDITEQRHSAERDHLAQKVFTHTPAGIIFTDEAHRILSINPATTQMTGYQLDELQGRTVFGLISPNHDETPESFRENISLRGSWNGELEITPKCGDDFPAGIRITRVDDQHSGDAAHYIWIIADITERKQAEERMRHIAQHDALTGLPNRLALLMRLAQLLPEARRHKWSIAIMFIDLDRFKIINDTLGHQVGDELLREVASRLAGVVRETDFVARLGGDEFVVILPAITTPADAAIVASKIVAALSTPIEAEGHELHTSPSIGISIFPDDGPDGDTILKNADTAMYHAKAAGRNNYQFFAAEMNRVTAERLDIERKLRHAIARNELALCFQPQFRADSSHATGVEALVRWHHPTDGMIAPDRFIPVAEETGIIVEIGEWVLLTACREMKHWIDAGLKPIRIAVNVSARQLRRRDFCETVAGALAESGLPAELLELEITESSVMENPEEAVLILQRLGRMGISLAIDDFGTGYSSLAYLKLFPIDHLKIDRSFVADIEHDLNDRAIAFGTIALAHSLGLNVIAEGVETEDQLELLRTNGCDEVQGYLFSKPLNSAAAFAFLHARDLAG